MRISDLNPLNWNARRALERTVATIARRVLPREPGRTASFEQPGTGKPSDFGAAAEGVVGAAARAALAPGGTPQPPSVAEQARRYAMRGASPGNPPPSVPGAGYIDLGWRFLDPDPEQQRLWASEEAKFGRATTAYGPTPQAYGSMASVGLTIERLAIINAEANRDGYLTHKADLDVEVHQKWGHQKTAHRQRVAAVFRNSLQLRPRSKTDLGRFVCAFTRSVFDDTPGFLKYEEDLLGAGRSGYAGSEVVWKTPRTRTVAVGRKSYAVRNAKALESLEWIHPRDFRWNPIRRRMLLDAGGSRYIDPFTNPDGTPTRKLVLHGGDGEGDPHQRGYAFATNLLYLLTMQSLPRWAVALEYFGVATPYLQYDGEGFADGGDVAEALAFLAALGRGQPALLHQKWGKVDVTPTPQGIDARGQHAAILGYLNSEASKCIAGQTLTMEIGGSGSYAAANTHSDSKEDVQIIDARLEADTQTHQLCRFVVEENAVALARAFGCSPAQVLAEVPVAYRVVDRRMDPADRLTVFIGAQNELGLRLDPDQIAEELNLRLLSQDDAPEDEEGGPPDEEGEDSAGEPGEEGAAAPAPAPAQRAAALPARDDDPGVMVALYPPPELAAALALPGGEAPEDLHITLAFLGRASGVDLDAAQDAVAGVAGAHEPLAGQLGGIGLFPPSEASSGRAVAWVPVDVPGLTELRQALTEALAAEGLEVSAAHGFTPHLTLACLDPDAVPPAPVAPRAVAFTELFLVVGDERFPFSLE